MTVIVMRMFKSISKFRIARQTFFKIGTIPKQISTMATHIYQELEENNPPNATAIRTDCTARFARRVFNDFGKPEK